MSTPATAESPVAEVAPVSIGGAEFGFSLALYREDRTLLGLVPLAADLEPAREWTRFLGIRRARASTGEGSIETSVQLAWEEGLGEPFLHGFRVVLSQQGEERLGCDFIATSYFAQTVRALLASLVQQGTVAVGDKVLYCCLAKRVESTPSPVASPGFHATEVVRPLLLHEASLAAYLAAAEPFGAAAPEDIPVFVRREVLEVAERWTLEADGRETAGVLAGHLHRDRGQPDVFLEVTALLPARHTTADATRVSFTAETWTEARSELTRRGQGEIFAGWFHCHPAKNWSTAAAGEQPVTGQPHEQPLAEEPEPRSLDFFSPLDRTVHRVAFASAHSIALVTTHQVSGAVTHALYGWREGRIEDRGFFRLDRPLGGSRHGRKTAAGGER